MAVCCHLLYVDILDPSFSNFGLAVEMMTFIDFVCVTQVEAELQELEEEEALEYLQSLGVGEGGLRSLIAATYKQLGLLTYFTTGRSKSAIAPYRQTAYICRQIRLVYPNVQNSHAA